MRTTGVRVSPERNAVTMAMTSESATPSARARSDARWITGPSAIGSEKGTPSSIASAPAATSAFISGTVVAGDGSPAVTYGINAVRPAERSRANVASIRFTPPSSPRRVTLRTAVELETHAIGDGSHVLVAAAREVHQQHRFAR